MISEPSASICTVGFCAVPTLISMNHIALALLNVSIALSATAWVHLLPAGEFKGRDGRPDKGKTWKLNSDQSPSTKLRMVTPQMPDRLMSTTLLMVPAMASLNWLPLTLRTLPRRMALMPMARGLPDWVAPNQSETPGTRQ